MRQVPAVLCLNVPPLPFATSLPLYDCATSALHRPCSHPWQLLQLPTSTLHQLPAPPPVLSSSSSPQQQVVQVAAGDAHCLLLTAAGSVWALGSNRCGQIGVSCEEGSKQQPHQPQQNVLPSAQSSAVVTPVLVLGPGAAAAGGVMVCQEAVAQIAAGSCHSAAVTAARGNLYCWGWNAHGQCCVGEPLQHCM
jgi:alpha-tubulin suppressor-like RCC1 family protein